MIITRIVLPAIVLAGTFPSPARPPSTPFFDDDLTAPSATLFQFESRFWPNLQHFLYVRGRHRAGAADRLRSAVVEAPSDTTGFGALPAEDRQAWEEAVAYYSTEARDLARDPVLHRGWATRAQVGTTHVPYAERAGVWRRGVAGRREVLEREWLPWLEGRASFDDALARVVAGWPTQRRD